MELEYLDPQHFNWSRWRRRSLPDLGILRCRLNILLENKHTLRDHFVGYCQSENLICRPKLNHKAVMFFKDDIHFWFHITNKEFENVFER